MSKNNLGTPHRRRIVEDHCRRMKDRGSATISKALFKKYPLHFPSLNSALCAVRYARGAQGEKHRKSVKGKELIRPLANPGDYMMPASRSHDRQSVRLEEGNWLVMSDLHIPYHDIPAIEAALEMGEDAEVDGILLNGDLGDFYSISRFLQNPKERDLAGEVNATRQFLGYLRKRFPQARIVLKKGNHDERWEHYIWQKSPELFNLDSVQYEAVLHLHEFNIQLAGGRTIIQAGKLTGVHGHEIEQGASSPVNPARGLFMRTLDSYFMGHRHRTSEHTEKTANGRFITCWSFGCLCGLWPEYAIINKWNHGAGIIEIKPGGSFTVHNRRILDGKVL